MNVIFKYYTKLSTRIRIVLKWLRERL